MMEFMEAYDTTDEETEDMPARPSVAADDAATTGPQLQLTVLQPTPSRTCPHGLVRYIDPCSKCWRRLQEEARLWVIRPEGVLCEHDMLNCEVCDWRRLCKGCGVEFVRRPGRTCGRCVARAEQERAEQAHAQQQKMQAQAPTQQGLFLDLAVRDLPQEGDADRRYQL